MMYRFCNYTIFIQQVKLEALLSQDCSSRQIVQSARSISSKSRSIKYGQLTSSRRFIIPVVIQSKWNRFLILIDRIFCVETDVNCSFRALNFELSKHIDITLTLLATRAIANVHHPRLSLVKMTTIDTQRFNEEDNSGNGTTDDNMNDDKTGFNGKTLTRYGFLTQMVES